MILNRLLCISVSFFSVVCLVGCNEESQDVASKLPGNTADYSQTLKELLSGNSEVKISKLESSSLGADMLLKEVGGDRFLSIGIGIFEARSIARGIQHAVFSRPLTHDLMHSVITHLDAEVLAVAVTELKSDTFFGKVYVLWNGEVVTLDSRPSDAIALALRAGVKIFVSEAVMQDAGFIPQRLNQQPGQVAVVP